MHGSIGKRAGKVVLVLSAFSIVIGVWAVFPRNANLVGFDPDRMAEMDTAMWRDYYDKKYLALFSELYALSREQFGFSPLDSLRIAVSAARAAKTFQPTASRAAAEAAVPDLANYYGLLAKAAPKPFDVSKAAELELDWWQARREHVSPEDYGLTIARTSSLVYGIDNAKLREAGILRAKAMAYRDAHGDDMTEADWAAINLQLRASYNALKQGIRGS